MAQTVQYLASRINTMLGQYTFTSMYTEQDIIFNINNALVDLYLYHPFDFLVKTYSTSSAATTHTLPGRIYQVIACYKVDTAGTETKLTLKKYQNTFSTGTAADVNEFSYLDDTVYLPSDNNIKIIYIQGPAWYTSVDTTVLDIPNDFLGALTKIIMGNMLPLYLSDGIALGQDYLNKAEIQLQRLAGRFGKKYSNLYLKPEGENGRNAN